MWSQQATKLMCRFVFLGNRQWIDLLHYILGKAPFGD